MIPFNVPPCVGEEIEYVKQAIASHKICGDGAFTKQCNAWLEERFHAQKVLLTTSGTTALDMAMLLCDIQPGDEVILPASPSPAPPLPPCWPGPSSSLWTCAPTR